MLLFLILARWFFLGALAFAVASAAVILGGLYVIARVLFYGSAYLYGWWTGNRERKQRPVAALAPKPPAKKVLDDDGYTDTRASRDIEGIEQYLWPSRAS